MKKPFGREVLDRENKMRPSNTTTTTPRLKPLRKSIVPKGGTKRDPGLSGGGKAIRKQGNMYRPSKSHPDNLQGNFDGRSGGIA